MRCLFQMAESRSQATYVEYCRFSARQCVHAPYAFTQRGAKNNTAWRLFFHAPTRQRRPHSTNQYHGCAVRMRKKRCQQMSLEARAKAINHHVCLGTGWEAIPVLEYPPNNTPFHRGRGAVRYNGSR